MFRFAVIWIQLRVVYMNGIVDFLLVYPADTMLWMKGTGTIGVPGNYSRRGKFRGGSGKGVVVSFCPHGAGHRGQLAIFQHTASIHTYIC